MLRQALLHLDTHFDHVHLLHFALVNDLGRLNEHFRGVAGQLLLKALLHADGPTAVVLLWRHAAEQFAARLLGHQDGHIRGLDAFHQVRQHDDLDDCFHGVPLMRCCSVITITQVES